MNYCSKCGLKLIRQWIDEDRRDRYVCGGCHTIHYENPRVIVSCCVHWRDEVLMCRRARDPARGQWEVPSGFLEIGETLEQGAARETWEETGVVVDPLSLELCSVVNMASIAQVAIYFRMEVIEKPTLVAGPECLEVAFMPEQSIPPEQFAWRQSMGSVPERFFNELRSREFTIQFVSIASSNGVGFRSREYKVDSITDTLAT